jgi:tetratricopeptide (TPR) repeat protein
MGYSHVECVAWSGQSERIAGTRHKVDKKGVELDGIPSALLAYLYLLTRQHEKAIDESSRAVEFDPNSATTQMFLGYCLKWVGRFDESVNEFEQAIRLDPFPSSTYWRGMGNPLSFSCHILMVP